jgi:predicted aspartyl protease
VTDSRRIRRAIDVGEVRATPKVRNPLLQDSPVLELDACVDTGAVRVWLGREVVEKLELPITGKAVVILADDSQQAMDKAGPVYLEIGERGDYFSCLVGPVGCEPLIGQIVLEALDLLVDGSRQALRPRPESPAYPSYKMK